mmetsp:Transcript_29952/g.74975  ORF Transcript_29952/g.74975 Transcript_29952/m.74975 type:complete len:232 (-) Transcript_29952:398-1093(-)
MCCAGRGATRKRSAATHAALTGPSASLVATSRSSDGKPPSPAVPGAPWCGEATPTVQRCTSGERSTPPLAPTASAAAANAVAASPSAAAATAASRMDDAMSGSNTDAVPRASSPAGVVRASDARAVSTAATTRHARAVAAARAAAGRCVARAAISAASPGSTRGPDSASSAVRETREASKRAAAAVIAAAAPAGGGSPARCRTSARVPHPTASTSISDSGRDTTAGATEDV